MLQKRLKEQTCLYHIAALNEYELSIEQLMEEAVRLLPGGWQHEDLVEASVSFDGKSWTTSDYGETPSSITEATQVRPGMPLRLEVAYLEQPASDKSDPFLKEERELLHTALEHLSRKVEQKLDQREREEKQMLLDKAYQLAHIGIWEFDMQTHELEWSDVTKKVHGFGPDYEPDVESTINLFKEGVNRQQFAEAARGAIEEEKPFDVELKIISGEGDERWIRAKGVPEYVDGVCTRFYGISQNVTDRRRAEEDLLLNERRFRSLVQDGSDMLAILDSEANYRYVSPTSEKILGIAAEEFVGNNALDYVHPDDRDRLLGVLEELSPGRRMQLEPFRFRNAEHEWRWIETTVTDLTEEPAVGGLVCNSRDVTEQINQRQKTLQGLKEKEILLSEIHHRVKNNLAVVSGMMQLQMTQEADSELNDKLLDSIIRIKTMAGIHDHLYQSKSFSRLEFADNIRSLIIDIQNTLQTDTLVELVFDCDPVQLGINQAIPCSLIVNEVVTNIFKHAFPGRENGTVHVNLHTSDDGRVQLSLADDGVGLPENMKSGNSGSLGMELISLLSQQLEATYRFDSGEQGTAFFLSFEPDNQKGIGNGML